MTERRYTDDEATAIFERAAEAEASGRTLARRSAGRTLAELQAIGEEAGIPRDLVARAAVSLDRAGRPTVGRFLGFPIAVGRTVELGRRLTDEEWERLVVDLRETFDARGRVSGDGAFRQWTNGNLQALLEPSETGHRLRLRTMKGDARGFMTGGLALVGIAAALFLTLLLTGNLDGDLASSILLALIGTGLFGAGALRLPGWAGRREEQMEGIAARHALPPAAVDPDARGGTSHGAAPPDARIGG